MRQGLGSSSYPTNLSSDALKISGLQEVPVSADNYLVQALFGMCKLLGLLFFLFLWPT